MATGRRQRQFGERVEPMQVRVGLVPDELPHGRPAVARLARRVSRSADLNANHGQGESASAEAELAAQFPERRRRPDAPAPAAGVAEQARPAGRRTPARRRPAPARDVARSVTSRMSWLTTTIARPLCGQRFELVQQHRGVALILPEGRLVEQQQALTEHQHRRHAQAALLAVAQRERVGLRPAAAARSRPASRWPASRTSVSGRPARRRPVRHVVQDGLAHELVLRILEDVADISRQLGLSGRRGDVLPVHQDRPGRRLMIPAISRASVLLPVPFAPTIATSSPRWTSKLMS